MSESQCCPVCDRAAMHPRWPFVRTTPWTDDCACSDYSHCMMHRYGDEQPPKRPSQEVMTARAQAVFERACEDHAHLLAKFADYEQLKKERDEARTIVDFLKAANESDLRLLRATEAALDATHAIEQERDEARAEVERLKAERDHLEVLWKAEMEHANKWAARARKAEADFSYMNRIRDHLQGQVLELQRDRETACENTPTKGCECPGCCTARERAERGEA